MSEPRFTVYRGKDKGAHCWRWKFQAANNRILATGEGFTRKRDAERAVQTVKEAVWGVVMLGDSV